MLLQLLHVDTPLEKVAQGTTLTLPPNTPSMEHFSIIAHCLQQEKAVSLTQVKSMLEYILWGPNNLTLASDSDVDCRSIESTPSESILQRWLDLERATVLNNLIRTQGLWNIELTVFEEYHLLFLVRTSAHGLKEASAYIHNESTNF